MIWNVFSDLRVAPVSILRWLRRDRQLWIVIAVTVVTFGFGFHWGLPKAVSTETVATWAVDSIPPIAPLNEAYHRFSREGNEWLTYPLFHYMVLDAVYAPYLLLQWLTGNVGAPSSQFPYGLNDPQTICRDLSLLSKLVSFLMGVGIVLGIYKVTEELFSRRAALVSGLMVSLFAPVTFYAKMSNLDVPYLFWSTLAFVQYVRIIKLQQTSDYVGFGVWAALATATKDQAYGLFVLSPFSLAVALVRHESGVISLTRSAKALFRKPILMAGAAAVLVYSIANNIPFGGWSGFIRHVEVITGPGSEPWRMYPATLTGELSLALRSMVLLGQSLGWCTFILSLAGVAWSVVMKRWLALSLLNFAVAYFTFFLSVIGFVYTRFLIGPALILLVFASAFVTEFLGSTRMKLGSAAIAACLLCQSLVTVDLTLSLTSDSRYDAESWIRTRIPRGATVESYVLERYLPRVLDICSVVVVGRSASEVSDYTPSDAFSAEAIYRRRPDFIVVLQGLGVSGDPETWSNPETVKYYRLLLDEKLDYRVVAAFETASILPYRLIPGTKGTTVVLARSGVPIM